jgi:hypothetical protein
LWAAEWYSQVEFHFQLISRMHKDCRSPPAAYAAAANPRWQAAGEALLMLPCYVNMQAVAALLGEHW